MTNVLASSNVDVMAAMGLGEEEEEGAEAEAEGAAAAGVVGTGAVGLEASGADMMEDERENNKICQSIIYE